jgi:outer membrane protein with beta-barrel domain
MSRPTALAIAICTLVALVLPQPADAQGTLRLRGYFVGGSTWLTATDSFDAVAGSHRASSIGGGAALTIWKDAFVDVAVLRMKVDGQRVFVDQGTVFDLNIPLHVTMIPFDVAGGWRMAGRVSPYGAVGVSRISYSERSDFAAPGEDVNSSGTGLLVLVGADVTFSRLWHVGADLRYRSVEGPLGQTGVSAFFDERSIGGFAASVRVSVGH